MSWNSIYIQLFHKSLESSNVILSVSCYCCCVYQKCMCKLFISIFRERERDMKRKYFFVLFGIYSSDISSSSYFELTFNAIVWLEVFHQEKFIKHLKYQLLVKGTFAGTNFQHLSFKFVVFLFFPKRMNFFCHKTLYWSSLSWGFESKSPRIFSSKSTTFSLFYSSPLSHKKRQACNVIQLDGKKLERLSLNPHIHTHTHTNCLPSSQLGYGMQ